MIESMDKIQLFLFYRDKKRILGRLQKLGLLHLEIDESDEGDKIRKLKNLKKRYQSLINILKKVEKEPGPATSLAPPESMTNRQLLHHLETVLSRRETYQGSIEELQKDLATLEPWGDFDHRRLDELKAKGLKVHFYIASEKSFARYDFSDLVIEEIKRESGKVYFLLFSLYQEPPTIPFEEVDIPSRSETEIKQDIDILKKMLLRDLSDLKHHTRSRPVLEREGRSLQALIDFEKAKRSLDRNETEHIFHIEGYLPAKRRNDVISFLDKNNISYVIDRPTEEENVPILLRSNAFTKLFAPITKIFSLPSYNELDPTPFFAPFFILFFGLCLGDVGYGFILALLSIPILLKAPQNWKFIGILGLVLGASTAFSGVLLNTFFGYPIFAVSGEEQYITRQGSELAVFAARSASVDGPTVFPAMTLALMLGYIQVMLGIFLQIFNAIRRNGPLYAIKPFGILLMIPGATVLAVHGDFLNLGFNREFTIGPLEIGARIAALPEVVGSSLLISGLVIFFLFSNPALNIFLRPFSGLWDFYQLITSLPGDILSYIRLFALGLASGLLGNAFNHIAMMILPGGPENPEFFSPLLIFSILILLAGHTVNLALSTLGAFVHPLRLTFVEFYKNLQFEGGGREFKPFSAHKEI